MKNTLPMLLAALAVGLAAFDAAAQAGPGPSSMQGTASMSVSRECGKARDPQRCEALQQAKEQCKDKSAAEKRQCIQSAMPPMDCSKARHPDRCAAHQKAKEICKDKAGKDYRQCMRENSPKKKAQKAGKRKSGPKS